MWDVTCKHWRRCRLDAQFKPRRQAVGDWTGSPTFKPRSGRISHGCRHLALISLCGYRVECALVENRPGRVA